MVSVKWASRRVAAEPCIERSVARFQAETKGRSYGSGGLLLSVIGTPRAIVW